MGAFSRLLRRRSRGQPPPVLVKVLSCRHCREIVDQGSFFPAFDGRGRRNPAQGACRNCGSREFTEGAMGEKYERRYQAGKEHPIPTQVGPIMLSPSEDPLRPSRVFHFLGVLRPRWL